MADQFTSSFEHQILEADIKALAQEIQKHRASPEAKNLAEKELLSLAVRTLPAAPAEKKPRAAQPQTAAQNPLPQYAQDASSETKLEIEYLLDLAFHAGIGKAEAEARKYPDFIQDAFHDALAGKLYPELQKLGILK